MLIHRHSAVTLTQSMMPGLSAKVFRTYNASFTLEQVRVMMSHCDHVALCARVCCNGVVLSSHDHMRLMIAGVGQEDIPCRRVAA